MDLPPKLQTTRRMNKISRIWQSFTENQKSGGLVLIACTILSLFLANSENQQNYLGLWSTHFYGHSLADWINDGLMTVFFLMVGLELEREIYKGELSHLKKALLPVIAALGGMLVPAGFYLWRNYGEITQSGAGIPMATDIAFALGVLSLLGKRVPISLKIFLTALAVIDDLGAILVIAFFYSTHLDWMNLSFALGIFALLLILNRLKVYILLPYLIGGIFMWYFMLNSGVHATITGVLLAFAIPFQDGTEKTISYKLQSFLHKPINFFILPIFALANTAIPVEGEISSLFTHHYSIGIMLGLCLGKPLGITLFSYIACKLKICKLPENVNWTKMLGVGFLGGIGFTMSIFITLLAFDPVIHADYIDNAKLSILLSSLLSGIIGFTFLSLVLKNPKN